MTSNSDKEHIIKELEHIPEVFLPRILQFIQTLRIESNNAYPVQDEVHTHLLCEDVLGREWLTSKEDEAWGKL